MSLSREHVLDLVDPLIHGVLSLAEERAVKQHCEACPTCQAALSDAEKRLELYQDLPILEASQDLLAKTRARVEKRHRRDRRVYRSLAAAGMIAILTFGAWHWRVATANPAIYSMRVLGQSDWVAGGNTGLRVMVLDAKSSRQLPDVPVTVTLSKEDQAPVTLASERTDETGAATLTFAVPDWKPGQYRLQIAAGAGSKYFVSGDDLLSRTVELTGGRNVVVSTDKPTYQPGQTIRMRGLALRRADRHPAADDDVQFSIADPQGNLIFQKSLRTSQFGIAAADCPLAVGIREGKYQVRCRVGDIERSQNIDVKAYVLPRIKIAAKTDKRVYQPGENGTLSIKADYFFDQPVNGGRVLVEFQQQGKDNSSPGLAPVESQLDSQGQGTVTFVIPKVDSAQANLGVSDTNRQIAATITVRDGAGQQHSRTESFAVAASQLQLHVLPEGGSLVPGLENNVYILVRDANGQPVRARVRITGDSIYEVMTDESGVGVLSVVPSPRLSRSAMSSLGYSRQPETAKWIVRWQIQVQDNAGQTLNRTVQLACVEDSWPLLLRTHESILSVGEQLHVETAAKGDQPIYVDYIRNGQTLASDVIRLEKGRGVIVRGLTDEFAGVVEVCAYRMSGTNVTSRSQRTIVVKPRDALQIRTVLDQPEYRPGQRARLRFTLTGRDGKPAPGALSLAGVDEAVFALLPSTPEQDQESLLYGDADLLGPVRAIASWNSLDNSTVPAPQRRRFEQALFSAASRSSTTLDFIDETASRGRSLNRDWEGGVALANGVMPKSAGNPHSLRASSLPGKLARFEASRKDSLAVFEKVWFGVFGFAWLAGILVSFGYDSRRLGPCVLGASIAIAFFLLLTFGSTQSKHIAEMSKAVAVEAPAMSMPDSSLRSIGYSRFRDFRDGTGPTIMMGERVPDHKILDLPKQAGEVAVRVRREFPETLLWRPELITDERGEAMLDVELADSISTWRVSAAAISTEGHFGSSQIPIRAFQPFFVDFNLPVRLTRGDLVAVPVIVSNYLDKRQQVQITLADSPAFERLDPAEQLVDLAAGEVKRVEYRLRALRIGEQALRVTARTMADKDSKAVEDAVERQIRVIPEGTPHEQFYSGTLREISSFNVEAPAESVAGSLQSELTIYPTRFTQVVEGLEGIFQYPHGCFEQTSSTTYPNVMALDYLRRTNRKSADVQERATNFVQAGYQRLLSFEVPGGGFSWYGQGPAIPTLTAYGLMEFQDMARVYPVDSFLIKRTRHWLLLQRQQNGSWNPDQFASRISGSSDHLQRLATTAYITWSLGVSGAGGDSALSELKTSWNYLASQDVQQINDPYVLALIANALLTHDSTTDAARPFLVRLKSLVQSSADGKRIWWSTSQDTVFYGRGQGGSVETTALALLALLQTPVDRPLIQSGIDWLITQKQARGTWYSTQATVLVLKVLVTATERTNAAGELDRKIQLLVDGKSVRDIVIPRDQREVLQRIDLSDKLVSGSHHLELQDPSGTDIVYQLALRWHSPVRDGGVKPDKPAAADHTLAMSLGYDRRELTVNESLKVTATLENRGKQPASLVMASLPIPAGFALDVDGLDSLVQSRKIDKYEQRDNTLFLYLRGLEPQQSWQADYRLRPTMPAEVQAAGAKAWEYYTPENQSQTAPTRLKVTR